MELLQSPPALLLYLAAAGLTAWGTMVKRGSVPAFLGGLCWSAGTVAALVDGASLDGILCVTLALLLISVNVRRRKAAEP